MKKLLIFIVCLCLLSCVPTKNKGNGLGCDSPEFGYRKKFKS